jgi:beta-glucanase (GH16 family)
VLTIKIISARADSNHAIALDHGGTKVTAYTTNYGSDDAGSVGGIIDWPKDAGYPTVHNTAGGVGTFNDPITAAIDSKNGPDGDVPFNSSYTIGEKFYVPRLHLYFVAEDSCNTSSGCGYTGTDKDTSSGLHIDFFVGNVSDTTNLTKCELSFGDLTTGTDAIANAGDGYPMPDQYPNGTSLFDASTNTCIGKTLWNSYSDWTVGGNSGMSSQPGDVDDSVQGSGKKQFNYSGSGWGHCTSCDNSNSGFYNGSNSWDNTAGDSVSFAFTATGTNTVLTFYGVTGPAHGIGEVSMDGGASKTIDFYAESEAGNTLLYTSDPLSAGDHTFTLTVTGKKNDNATWNGINPDRVHVQPGTVTIDNPNKPKSALGPGNGTWTMIWNDNFSGGSIDTSKWTVCDKDCMKNLYKDGKRINNEQECYQDDGQHTRIDGSGSDRHLVLEADQQSGNSTCPYISGRMDTQGKYLVQPPKDGHPVRVEANIQLPPGGAGTWPAFWMLGQNISDPSVGWPNCGEIDIMENIGWANMIQGTIHGLNDSSQYEQYTLPGDKKFSDAYHLFAVDWYTDHIDLLVDGNVYKSIDTSQLGGDQVFNQPFYILLNFAVGGDWPGSPNDATVFPQQMNVSSVSVYQQN